MLFKEIIAVYSENHTKSYLLLKQLGHIVTTGLQSVNMYRHKSVSVLYAVRGA
jgi:hypothetical protein